jgi:hypothetical protein
MSSSSRLPVYNRNANVGPLPEPGASRRRDRSSMFNSSKRHPLTSIDGNLRSHRRTTPLVGLSSLGEEEEPEENSGPRSHQLAKKPVIRRAEGMASKASSKASLRSKEILRRTGHSGQFHRDIGPVGENNEGNQLIRQVNGGSRKRTVKRNKRNSRKRTTKRKTNRRHVRK